MIIYNTIFNSSISIIRNVLNFTYVENTGGAFGIFNNNILFFIIMNIIIVLLIILLIISKIKDINKYSLIGISIVLAGGISNLIDRLSRGFVIDYIDINKLINYPIFNIADIFIVIGFIIIVFNLIISLFKDRKEKTIIE